MIATHETRLNVLDGQVLKLEDILSIVTRATKELDQKMVGMKASHPLYQKLIVEKEKLTVRENQIKAFNKNADQRHYFYALLSELEAAFLAAQVLESGELQAKKSENKAAGYVAKVIELVPVVGKVLSTCITGVADVVSTYTYVKERTAFMRIRSLAITVDDFDQIAIRVAVECTLKNEATLAKLHGAKVPQDWKTTVKSMKDGVEGLMTEFMKDNETQAKVLGRLDAYRVIAHLQEEAISENYSMTEDEENGIPPLGRKPSVIAHHITNAVMKPKVDPSQAAETE